MSKHTPGEWKTRALNTPNPFVVLSNGEEICIDGTDAKTNVANTNLIASSPRLLTDLEYALSIFESLRPVLLDQIADELDESIDITRLKITIRKARGE